MPSFTCYPFIITPSFSHPTSLSISILPFSVLLALSLCLVWLGRCNGPCWQLVPSLLLQGELSPPSFRPMNTAWKMHVCVCVCVLRRLWQRGGREALLALPETAECVDSHAQVEFAKNDLSTMGVSQPQSGGADPSGSKPLNQMTLQCCKVRRVCRCVMRPRTFSNYTLAHICTGE